VEEIKLLGERRREKRKNIPQRNEGRKERREPTPSFRGRGRLTSCWGAASEITF